MNLLKYLPIHPIHTSNGSINVFNSLLNFPSLSLPIIHLLFFITTEKQHIYLLLPAFSISQTSIRPLSHPIPPKQTSSNRESWEFKMKQWNRIVGSGMASSPKAVRNILYVRIAIASTYLGTQGSLLFLFVSLFCFWVVVFFSRRQSLITPLLLSLTFLKPFASYLFPTIPGIIHNHLSISGQ